MPPALMKLKHKGEIVMPDGKNNEQQVNNQQQRNRQQRREPTYEEKLAQALKHRREQMDRHHKRKSAITERFGSDANLAGGPYKEQNSVPFKTVVDKYNDKEMYEKATRDKGQDMYTSLSTAQKKYQEQEAVKNGNNRTAVKNQELGKPKTMMN